MSYYILCTPNISEGKNKDIIETCAAAISSVDGVLLLDVDSSQTNNRTIFNFVGNSSSIVEAALNLCRAAYNLIDISKHRGYQPRIGVISACPFVPLRNEDIDKCVEVAHEFAKQLTEEVAAPVYIYGESVTDEKRRNIIEDLFSTEYEDLKDKILKEELQPDYGVAEFVPQWGATLVGARKFLVYFNINLLGTKEQAVHIGNKLEEKYNTVEGDTKKEDIQCAGWFSDELNIAQISINIINFEKTPINEVYEMALSIAKEVNASVIGSQLVGTVPISLITHTAESVMEKDNLLILDEDQKIRLVIGKLGLNTITQFNPKEKIIEYIIENSEESASGGSSAISLENALLNLTVSDFVQAVAARNSTPGLGSVSTLIALMGTSIATMNGLLSYGKCTSNEATENQVLRKTIPIIYKIHKDLLPFIDRHALLAFEYSKITALQLDSEKDKNLKKDIESKSIERCLECPRETAEFLDKLWEPLLETLPSLESQRKEEFKMAGKFILVALEGLLSLIKTYPNDCNKEIIEEVEKYVKNGQSKLQSFS